MEFATSRPDIVRSASQRGLLSYWNGARNGMSLPIWQGLQGALAQWSADLSLTEVVIDDGLPRFRIQFHGTRIAELYGRANCVGKFLDEILAPAYSATALATYRQVVATYLPVYTIADMRDGGGRIVHYERLLLPFGRESSGVERILASLETVSPEGSIDRHGLMQAPEKAPAFAFLTTIQH